MKFVKKRKPRGIKKNEHRSMDMCPNCFGFNCDPMGMSQAFQEKIRKRLEAGLCGACGHNPCTCKSSINPTKVGRIVGGNVKKETAKEVSVPKKGPKFGFCKKWDPETPRISVIFSGDITKGWTIFDTPTEAYEAFEKAFSKELRDSRPIPISKKKDKIIDMKELNAILEE